MKDRGITPTPHDDPPIDAAWRAASQEEPFAHVDAAILAAARAAVDGEAKRRVDTPRAPWWQHWQPLAAAAGVAGLALVLAQRLPTDAPVGEAARTPASEPARIESYEPPGVVASERPAAKAADAAANTADSTPPVAQQEPSAKAADGYGIASSAAEMARAPAARAASGATADAALPGPTPEHRAVRIEELHASGQLALAAEELRTFRHLHADADAYLPQDLRAWAATVDSQASE